MPVSRTLAPVRIAAALAAAAIALLLLAAGARAATVVSGDFETGNLDGWTVVNSEAEPGGWFAYTGTANPLFAEATVPPPPDGTYAAITAQLGPGNHILYQDVALAPGLAQTLKLTVYYQAEASLTVPDPDTLSPGVSPNEQYRVDVVKLSAPLESLAASDILAPVFATRTDGPSSIAPRVISVDLAPFAGQTVRLRLAEVDTEGPLSGGVDDVSIAPTVPPVIPTAPIVPPPPSNAFTLGKLKLNRKNGTATIAVTVPGAGALAAADAKAGRKTVRRQTLALRSTSATAATAGTTTLKLRPTSAGKQTLRAKGKLRFNALVTFTPAGGTAATQTLKGTLKLTVAKATARP